MVVDDAFDLGSWSLKPYRYMHLDQEQKIFNYRLSRAKRVVKNSFGILASRRYLVTTIAPTWRTDVAENSWKRLEALSGNTSSKAGKHQREYVKSYYSFPDGSVPWQEQWLKDPVQSTKIKITIYM